MLGLSEQPNRMVEIVKFQNCSGENRTPGNSKTWYLGKVCVQTCHSPQKKIEINSKIIIVMFYNI
jgi:hypothetical protein